MDFSVIEAHSERLVQANAAYLNGLIGQITVTTRSIEPIYGVGKRRFIANAASLSSASLLTVQALAEYAIQDVYKRARADISADIATSQDQIFRDVTEDLVSDFARTSTEAINAAMAAQHEAEIHLALRYLSRFGALVSHFESRGSNAQNARTSASIYAKPPTFYFMDRAGRKWKTTRYVRTLMTTWLAYIYNDTYLAAARSQGIQIANVRNPNHPEDGMEFSIYDPSLDLPTYDQLRETVFHPNSSALAVVI